jgi:hypothetical protein
MLFADVGKVDIPVDYIGNSFAYLLNAESICCMTYCRDRLPIGLLQQHYSIWHR